MSPIPRTFFLSVFLRGPWEKSPARSEQKLPRDSLKKVVFLLRSGRLHAKMRCYRNDSLWRKSVPCPPQTPGGFSRLLSLGNLSI